MKVPAHAARLQKDLPLEDGKKTVGAVKDFPRRGRWGPDVEAKTSAGPDRFAQHGRRSGSDCVKVKLSDCCPIPTRGIGRVGGACGMVKDDLGRVIWISHEFARGNYYRGRGPVQRSAGSRFRANGRV